MPFLSADAEPSVLSGCVALLPVGDKPMDNDLLGQTGLCSCCPRTALGLSWPGGASELQPRHVDMYTCAVGWETWGNLNYQRRGGQSWKIIWTLEVKAKQNQNCVQSC